MTGTYKCLLCGVDHDIVNGRVIHTVFATVAPPANDRTTATTNEGTTYTATTEPPDVLP